MRTACSVSAALVVLASGKSDGTCGYQCTQDSQCGGCGTAGKCSCPDGKSANFSAISCSCVSAPANPPATPDADVATSAWPQKWRANVDAWSYGDFTDANATANGTFYYDASLGKTRGEWHPYTNGKDATQVWIVDNTSSHYYVKSGALCIYFPITDPGQSGTPIVGIEQPDWMKRCKDAGMATYVGREQVNVEGTDEWADHWSCHLDYEAAKQQITFQNWHSLGLGSVPKGLPVRVTGGNSAPNAQKGSPRLNSVWYKDFVTGDSATKPSDFDKPGGFCIPVGLAEMKAFFGHSVDSSHTFSPDFQRRAHYLPHAKSTSNDLRRARQPKPSSGFRADTFANTMEKLNSMLLQEKGLRTQTCKDFSLELLHQMQIELFNARAPELDAIYQKAGDTRQMSHSSLASLKQEQANTASLTDAALLAKARDGACHEMVLWYTHHLTESARRDIQDQLILPLLPSLQHHEPASPSQEEANVHRRYTAQASCAICHVDPTKTENIVV